MNFELYMFIEIKVLSISARNLLKVEFYFVDPTSDSTKIFGVSGSLFAIFICIFTDIPEAQTILKYITIEF